MVLLRSAILWASRKPRRNSVFWIRISIAIPSGPVSLIVHRGVDQKKK
jgi:hypothetical protein